MQCKITGADTTLLFTARILNKYDIKFYKSNDTGFIQTEEPYWLDEAYSSAITKLDVGLVYRNMQLKDTVSILLTKHFDKNGTFLDYAGGYGLFTRLMRDTGFNFYHTDKFCKNLFAEYFDLTDLPKDSRFELVTAFEAFEHFTNPLPEIKQILAYSDSLLFTTELQPANIKNVDDWAYFSTETGQHVSFYTKETLQSIADQLGYNFYTDGKFIHMFTRRTFDVNPIIPGKDSFLLRKAKKYVQAAKRKLGIPESLMLKDWQYIKDKLNQ